MMSLRKLYQRFRDWQLNPRHYEALGSETHRCSNCDQEYAGYYCPRCGQKARAGRITWTTVRNGLMDVIGLGGRSLPYSLWQLLCRPGYFISDYINGKWQVSFPPVKMLVIVALLVFFIGRLLFPEYWSVFLDEEQTAPASTGISYYVDRALDWLSIHPEWGFLFLFSFLILPTWFVFRRSPRNTRHTLPQGFFIQVFITVQFILWLFVLSLALMLTGWNGSELAPVVLTFLVPIMMLVDYRQLFGYGWWGTLWRLVMIVLMFGSSLILIACIDRVIMKSFGFIVEHQYRPLILLWLFASCLGLMVSLTDVINRKLWRVRGKWRSMMWPLLFLVAMILSFMTIEIQRPGALLKALFS